MQLADIDECDGRCFTASARFRSALREHGVGGTVIEFHSSEHNWFHQVTAVADGAKALTEETLIVDWTARQFEPDAPYPRIERLGDALARWGTIRVIDGTYATLTRSRSENPEAGPWSEAQQRIPEP